MRLRNASLVMVGLLLSLVLLHAAPASAHANYHHNGAQTTSRYAGSRATIEVTNPSVPTGTTDFLVARILSKGTQTQGLPWIEIGWVELGDHIGQNGYPIREVYVFDTVNEWYFPPGYQLTTGDIIDVRIVPLSSCSLSATSCYWGAQILVGGSWTTLRWVLLPMGILAYQEEYVEIANHNSGVHFEVATTGYLHWHDARLRTTAGVFNTWTPAHPTTSGNVLPYCVLWWSVYYSWSAERTESSCL